MIFKKTWQNALLVITSTLLFVLAYYQAPIFSSNQYQYFLHGLAQNGTGTLAEDWLANTVDPTPVFSFLVYITEKIHGRFLFNAYYLVLAGIYLFSLTSIVNTFVPVKKNNKTLFFFLTGIFIIHSAGLRWILLQMPGADWGYLFDGGVAGQRLLGQVLQPSAFGVFLILSISLYLDKKYIPASLSAVFACIMHPTYLLSSAVLILAYMADLWINESQKEKAIQTGMLALLTVSPIVTYTLIHFSGVSPDFTERAKEILVNTRIPHHALVNEWFDAGVVIKLILIGLSVVLIKSKKFRLLILLPLGIGLFLTLTQYFSGDLTLALIFPWRISTWLVPIASAILVGQMVISIPHDQKKTRLTLITAVVAIVLAVFSGFMNGWKDRREAELSPSVNLESHVIETRKPGEVYLIPVKMFDFRLKAGVPVYGDFYSVPYADVDVIEWYSQFLNAKHFYESGDCGLLEDLESQGVTHVVIPADFSTTCPELLKPIYEDNAYMLLSFFQR